MTEPHLTLEAEKAVRQYLFKIIVPTGAVLTVASFFLGFFIQKGAQNEAAKDAFVSVNDVLLAGVQDIASANTQAGQVSEELKRLQNEARVIAEKLRTAEAFSKSEDLVSQVAEAVSTRQDFISQITVIPTQIQTLSTQVESIQSSLRSPQHGELSSSGGNVKSQSCPPGAFMVGVRMQSDHGGPHGIVSTVIPVCKTMLGP